jgi:hypothetical protein
MLNFSCIIGVSRHRATIVDRCDQSEGVASGITTRSLRHCRTTSLILNAPPPQVAS